MTKVSCPKCDADVSASYQEADPSCGIMDGGWYCDTCDLPISEYQIRFEAEPNPTDVDLSSVRADHLDTPRPRVSTIPGTPGYEEFKRIARSWGYD